MVKNTWHWYIQSTFVTQFFFANIVFSLASGIGLQSPFFSLPCPIATFSYCQSMMHKEHISLGQRVGHFKVVPGESLSSKRVVVCRLIHCNFSNIHTPHTALYAPNMWCAGVNPPYHHIMIFLSLCIHIRTCALHAPFIHVNFLSKTSDTSKQAFLRTFI